MCNYVLLVFVAMKFVCERESDWWCFCMCVCVRQSLCLSMAHRVWSVFLFVQWKIHTNLLIFDDKTPPFANTLFSRSSLLLPFGISVSHKYYTELNIDLKQNRHIETHTHKYIEQANKSYFNKFAIWLMCAVFILCTVYPVHTTFFSIGVLRCSFALRSQYNDSL